MTIFFAKVQNVTKILIFQISSSQYSFNSDIQTAFILKNEVFTIGHNAFLTTSDQISNQTKPIVYNIKQEDIEKLSEDDVIQISPNGEISILWEKRLTSSDLTLFITHQCNANCVMCPQPPMKDEYSLFNTNLTLLKYVSKQPIKRIGITGGEPTTKKDDLITLLKEAYKIFPKTQVDLLTNAKKLSDFSLAKDLAMSNPNIIFCISFPSDNLDDFNEIMKAKLYKDVLTAIQNLGLLKQKVELRIVIIKQNYQRLLSIAEFIFRNFPFIYHITYMGMEVVGYAFDNIDIINISPKEYNDNLIKAVRFLHQRDIRVSVYNIPYCLVDEVLWKFLRNSISKWKQSYKQECNSCSLKSECSGIFTTTKINSFTLKPIIK
jgi:His-Xaa-Ser system radical SAM maturase HxsC